MIFFAKKLIRKYKKDLNLRDWDIDISISNYVKTKLHKNHKNKTAFLIINKQEATSLNALRDIIHVQMIQIQKGGINGKG